MIIILIILVIAFAVKSFIQHPHFSDVSEAGMFIGGEVEKTKFTTERYPAIYQLYQEESGIRVERFNRLSLFRTVSKCEVIDTEFVEDEVGSSLMPSGCGPNKVDRKIDYIVD